MFYFREIAAALALVDKLRRRARLEDRPRDAQFWQLAHDRLTEQLASARDDEPAAEGH